VAFFAISLRLFAVDERVLYAKHCRYLHFSGMKDNAMWSVDSYDQAEHTI